MENREVRPKLVIIGAGISGLAAAQCLVNHKVPCDISILEASDRVGGRIWTGEENLDYGAQYIHGRDNNPIYKIAAERGLIADYDDESESDEETSDSDDSDDSDEENYSFFTQKGSAIPLPIVREVCDVLDDILDDGNKFSRENVTVCDDESVGTFLHKAFYKYLRTSKDSEEIKSMKEAIFNWRLLQEKADNACKSVFELSLYAWGEYLECPGARYMEFKKGFSTIINAIMEDLPKSMIHLNTPVKRINWDPTSISAEDACQLQSGGTTNDKELSAASGPLHTQPKVTIQTSNGSVINADYVLVTCSLGVLKRSAHEFFRPLLPSSKLAVINRVGFGTVDKLYLEFQKAFWDQDCDGIQFAWLSDEELVLDCVENKFQKEYLRKDWYRGIQGFDTLYGHPNMLVGWVAGEEAEVMETVPDSVVMDICYELLKRFTNNSKMPKPTRFIRSRWHSEPHILGSYSYIKQGHKASDCDLLAEPVVVKQEPRVMFAGEHTHKQYFSTTHGALLSGQREGQRLIDHLSKISASPEAAATANA